MPRNGIRLSKRIEVFIRDADRDERTGELVPRCVYCRKPYTEVILTLNHVVPRISGGSNGLDNLVTACWGCNSLLKDANYGALSGRTGVSIPALRAREADVLSRPVCEAEGNRRHLRGLSAIRYPRPFFVDWILDMGRFNDARGNQRYGPWGVDLAETRCPWCVELCPSCLKGHLRARDEDEEGD